MIKYHQISISIKCSFTSAFIWFHIQPHRSLPIDPPVREPRTRGVDATGRETHLQGGTGRIWRCTVWSCMISMWRGDGQLTCEICVLILLRFNISDIVFRYIHWRESNFILFRQERLTELRNTLQNEQRCISFEPFGHWDPYRREKHTEFTDNVSHPWRDCFCENHAKLQKVVVTLNPFPAKPWKWRQEECWAAAKMRRQFGILQGVESGRFKTESFEVFDYGPRWLDLDVWCID